ncbi:insulinase family protein, partial [Streptomyces sp. NPDC053705]
GRPVLGTVDTINALNRGQIARFYKKHYDPTHHQVGGVRRRGGDGRDGGPARAGDGLTDPDGPAPVRRDQGRA